MSSKVQTTLTAVLVVYLAKFRHASCVNQLDNHYKLAQLSGAGISFQQTAHTTFDSSRYFGQHHGYNYLTPASTYKTFSPPPPEHHTSQTAPLALSLHADDYKKFDKTAQTFFIPRTRNLATLGNALNAKPEFYVPRSNVQQTEISTEKKEANLSQQDNKSTSGATNSIAYQSNGKPLSVSEDALNFYEQERFFKQASPSQQATAQFPPQDLSTLYNQNYGTQKAKTYSKEGFPNPTRINEISSSKTVSTTPVATFTSTCAQSAHQSVQQPSLLQSLQDETPSNSVNLLNKQNEYSANVERQQRLQVLRSLLAEYLALTLQSNPQAATFVQPQYTTSTNFKPLSTVSQSFSSNSFNDEQQPVPSSTKTLTSNTARKAHSIYGTPFLNYSENPNTNSFQKKK